VLAGTGWAARFGRASGQPVKRALEARTGVRDALFMDLLARCLEWDPERRITAEDALRHAWTGRVTGDARGPRHP